MPWDELNDDHAARCMMHHEHQRSSTRTGVRVYGHQFNRSCTLCWVHGWQSSCTPPCSRIDIFADEDAATPPCHSDVSRPAAPDTDPEITRLLLARATRAAATQGARAVKPAWRGKMVRVRAFVNDGFFVRVHFVMTQGLWASLRGIPFFVQGLHGNASCSDIHRACQSERYSSYENCLVQNQCDAYSDHDGWHEYFEQPIRGLVLPPADQTIELSCPAAWFFNQGVLGGHTDKGIYATDWATASAFRLRNAALVAAWVRVQPSIQQQAQAEWDRLTRGACAVVGAHLRGTDKFILPKVPPDRYFPLIDGFLAQRGSCAMVYLATDDARYQQAVIDRYGAQRVAQLNDGKITRAAGSRAIWRDDRSISSPHQKGLEVLLDTLLLAKCDFLLKSASSVSEFAIYFNPRLANRSYDFNLQGQPRPQFLARVPKGRAVSARDGPLVAREPSGTEFPALSADRAAVCLDHEEAGNTRVHPWQLERSQAICRGHGWQRSTCSPPCNQVSVFTGEGSICNSPLRPPHPMPTASNTEALLALAQRAATGGRQTAHRHEWRGKILRVRGFIQDGFWVRALLVISQGLWASLRRVPFFVHLHSNASCASLPTECATDPKSQPKQGCLCDAYASTGRASATGAYSGWEEYFLPVGDVPARSVYEQTTREQMIEMSCPAAWYFTESCMGGSMATKQEWGRGYPSRWDEAVALRARNAALVAAWVRVQPSIQQQAQAEWDRLTRGACAVVGAHLRGTDKFILPKVPPDRYFPLIDGFLAQRGSCAMVYLATDDARYQQAVIDRYGAQRVAQLNDGKITRAAGSRAIWRDDRSISSPHQKGLEVLLDTLLLAKCDFLLKSASSVSEFAIYFNPRLANRSYDFSIEEGQPQPVW